MRCVIEGMASVSRVGVTVVLCFRRPSNHIRRGSDRTIPMVEGDKRQGERHKGGRQGREGGKEGDREKDREGDREGDRENRERDRRLKIIEFIFKKITSFYLITFEVVG